MKGKLSKIKNIWHIRYTGPKIGCHAYQRQITGERRIRLHPINVPLANSIVGSGSGTNVEFEIVNILVDYNKRIHVGKLVA